MFKQKYNADLVKVPAVFTRLHDAISFKTVKPNIEKFKNNPLYKGAKLWNTLAADIRNLEDYSNFKSYLKEWASDVTMLNV